MKPICLTTLIYFLFCTISLNAQDENPAREFAEFVKNINTFNHQYPQEKVYLHFDNTGYFKGEAIWFKAYVVSAENNAFTPFSKVLYVELITPEGDIVETKKLKLEKGMANGGFILENELYAGYYQIRAYTQAMLNFGEEIVFSRVFPVFDTPEVAGDFSQKKMSVRGDEIRVETKRKKEPRKRSEINMQFFPEGGNLIAGIGNKVAFKVTNAQGEALEISGKIVDQNGNEVTDFSTFHLGMGSFELYPVSKKYKAVVDFNGKSRSFDLPDAIPSGYALKVDNIHPHILAVQVEKNAETLSQQLGITFTCRGKVYAFKSFTVNEEGKFAVRVPKKNFPSGVIQITMFTTEGKIMGQRQAFVNHNQYLPIKAAVTSTFEPYSPVQVSFEIKNGETPVEAGFSLSVRDAATETGTNYTDNMMYNLLLSSELKGYIENPAYYFEENDNRRKAALDLLLLTQGWTRYSWEQMAGKKPFNVKYGIEEGLILQGRVLSSLGSKPQENIEVSMWMYSPYGSSQQGKCVTDKEGKFNFGFADLYGTWEMSLMTKKKNKPFNSRITIDRNISPPLYPYSYYETREVVSKKKSVQKSQVVEINNPVNRLAKVDESIPMSYVLDEVTITEKAKMKIKDRGLRFASVVYDVRDELDKFRDEGGSETGDVLDFIMRTNQGFDCSNRGMKGIEGGTEYVCTYKARRVKFFIDNFPALAYDKRDLSMSNSSNSAQLSASTGGMYSRYVSDLDISEIESVIIAERDPGTFERDTYNSPGEGANMTGAREGTDIDVVSVYIYTNESGGRRKEPRGMRQTRFKGFAPKMQFYNPDYSIARLPDEKDFRRTLYWNPDVKTDKEGKATVDFFNNGTCKEIEISAEGLVGQGVPLIYKP